MRKINALARFSLSASVIAVGAAFATPVSAQTEGQAQAQTGTIDCVTIADGAQRTACVNTQVQAQTPAAAPSEAGSIIVTGTRIRRPNLQSPVPITSISQDELTNQGQVSIGDALNDLPALRSTFSQQNSGRFIGTAGQNFLDLRGLGTNRTLVLVNGRRHVNSSPGSFDVDVDNIPQDLVERVDVVTGGESAVYGSDAIAGVVNFVLKRNYDGFRIRGQAGISKYGDRPVDFVSTTLGHNFGDGRGNVAVNLEYTHAGELFFRDRARASRVCGFQPNEGVVDDPNLPDNVFRCGNRNPFVTVGGQIGLLSGDGTGLTFDTNGNLVITDPAQESFIDNGGTVVSDDPLIGATLRETGDLAVGRDRYMANLLAHYDFSDAFQPFIEASFIKQKVKQEGQPSFFQGFLEDFFGPSPNDPSQPLVPGLRCDNPFLTSQALGTLQAFGLCGDPPGGETFFLNRFNVDFGGRKELDKRDTYRVVAGVQGTFNKDWHYEVSANYGHFKSNLAAKNDLLLHDADGNPAGFALAIDAVRDPNTGQIVCRVNSTDPTQDPLGAANDAPDCVPINVFGFGSPSQAAVAYSNTTSHVFSKASQTDVIGFLSGNTGGFFNLPGGPVGFSIGAEYRRETAHQIADPVSASGGTFFNAFPEFDPPAFSVKEVFGEVEFPILKDKPFAQELTVSGAARFSDYNTSANHTFAWNANGIYSPVRGVRLRANYSRSVRVPTLGDLFTPPTVNFAFLADPCDQNNIGDNPNRAANCAALGVPTTVESTSSPCFAAVPSGSKGPVGSPFHNCLANTQTTQITSAGNPDLQEEVGKSLTLGGVLTPTFIPGFIFSVDYFHIKVTNLIAVLDGQTILNQCFNQTSTANQFCSLLAPRDPFGLFATPALTSAGVNFAKQTSKGIDFDASYRHKFRNGVRFDTRAIATYTFERNNFVDPTDPTFVDRQLSELGDPVFSGTLITGIGIGKFDLRHTMRYIGSMTDFAYEDTHSVGGRPPDNPDIADRIRTGAVVYHDLRIGFTVPHYNFYLGVDNVFNRHPPLGLTGAGEGSGIYNGIGRFFYAGAIVDLKTLGL
jgi:outer membrane receptor protein involved in Fe transport